MNYKLQTVTRMPAAATHSSGTAEAGVPISMCVPALPVVTVTY